MMHGQTKIKTVSVSCHST